MTATARPKRLGAFYTPDVVAHPVVRWALRGSATPLLDPSFGGCAFLRAGLDELKSMGRADPSLVFGIDIDQRTRRHAAPLIQDGVPPGNFAFGDFFQFSPTYFDTLFPAIVGNPPYVRLRLLADTQRRRVLSAAARQEAGLSAQASTWAYFIVHATGFLAAGGRLAFLLPGALLHTDYGNQVLEWLLMRFADVNVVRVRRKVFREVDETTVILLCSDYGRRATSVQYSEVINAADLSEALSSLPDRFQTATADQWTRQYLGSAGWRLWERLMSRQDVVRLSDVAEIRIGVVTGANDFFVRTRAEVAGPRSHWVPVISTSGLLQTSIWTENDQRRSILRGEKALMLNLRERPRNDDLLSLIRGAERKEIHRRYKCAAREPWFSLAVGEVPDAFLAYMGAQPKPIVLNRSRATSTNSVHRVWWKGRQPADSLAVGSHSALFRLAAEVYGRSYGGGVLKLEPGAARRMPIPLVRSAGQRLSRVDELERAGRSQEAQDVADEAVLATGLHLRWADIEALRNGASRLSQLRAEGKRI